LAIVHSDFIRFYGSRQDEIKSTLETFVPFVAVATLAQQYLHLQDSLEALRELYRQPLTDPKDTLFLLPFKEKAYQAILDYKKQMASGTAPEGRYPSLLELTRVPAAGDSSFSLLPKQDNRVFFRKEISSLWEVYLLF
jgi:hypothetical protein